MQVAVRAISRIRLRPVQLLSSLNIRPFSQGEWVREERCHLPHLAKVDGQLGLMVDFMLQDEPKPPSKRVIGRRVRTRVKRSQVRYCQRFEPLAAGVADLGEVPAQLCDRRDGFRESQHSLIPLTVKQASEAVGFRLSDMEQLLPTRERIRFGSPVQVIIRQHIQELEGNRSKTIPVCKPPRKENSNERVQRQDS